MSVSWPGTLAPDTLQAETDPGATPKWQGSGLPALEPAEVEVSIVMPCLNEAETLETCIRKAGRWLEGSGTAGEIIVADNGSTDGSQAIAARSGARVVSVGARGYGSALMGGFAAARGRYVVMGDADDSYDLGCLTPFLDKLREGYDLVMGNRFRGRIERGAMPFLHKYLGNPFLTGVGRLLFRSPCGDFHCGLRAFRKEAVDGLNLRTTGMEFASEMVVRATLHRLRIAEVPITLSPDGRRHPPHLNRWRDGWRHLRFLMLYSPRWLFLYPGVLLMLLGLLSGSWLLRGPIVVDDVAFDVQTLLYAALAVVIGFQAVLFAILGRIFAIGEGLLPPKQRLNELFTYVSFEYGLLLGSLLIVAGACGTAYAFSDWGAHSFGNLNPSRTLRMIIPATTALTLGFEILLSSFFLGVLSLKRHVATPG